MRIERTNSDNPNFAKLIKLLDEELYSRYGKDQEEYDEHNILDPIKHVVLIYNNSDPVGSGSFKEFDSDSVELKRMFVKKDYRGSGAATQILSELENWAEELGYLKMVLETGIGQPDAIKFYEKSGYSTIENFEPYVGMPLSICMSKKLLRHSV